MNQAMMRRTLEHFGHGCHTAINGLEVLEIMQIETFDVILMDVQMPKLDGIEATRRIRAQPQFAQEPYIIALTANHLERTRLACFEAGMNDFLTKPVSLNKLRTALYQSPNQEITAQIHSLESRLDELVALGDQEFMDGLLAAFQKDFHERYGRLKAALLEKNFPLIGKINHQIKGSAANLGARDLRQICLTLEESCQSLDLNLACLSIKQMEKEFDKLQVQLANWRRHQSHENTDR